MDACCTVSIFSIVHARTCKTCCALGIFLPDSPWDPVNRRNMTNLFDHPLQLTAATMNAHTREAEYAVRGPVALKATSMQEKLRVPEEAAKLPFKSIISCNIGNPQALGQKPITFIRQVAAACTYPPLLDIPGMLPRDVIDRARSYLSSTDRKGGIGAYTDSYGLRRVREEVAEFIQHRDGYPCDWNDIALTTGASEGVRRIIQAVIAHPNDGIMISAPQYPLYTCAITMCGGKSVFYYLNEDSRWTIDVAELERAYKAAVADGINVRGTVVINPGNPVGSVLDEEVIRSVITFARDRNLLIFADEVYQDNVYSSSKKFFSFKKCLRDLQRTCPLGYDNLQLVSFHTVSKGLVGECGQRGGYVEYVGFDPEMLLQFRKLAASTLSSNTLGQIIVGLMVNPPRSGDPSFELFKEETGHIYESLKRRSEKLYEKLNKLEGVTCQPIDGAMYAFPHVVFPQRAIEEAAKKFMPVDEMYCLAMVEEAGIVTVPGSGFGQISGTYHFRITILPPEEEMDQVIERLGVFHDNFLNKYRSSEIDHIM
jgi:alanine transaminase